MYIYQLCRKDKGLQNLQNIFVATCPPLPALENGQIIYTRDPVNGAYPWETEASFECDEYFSLTWAIIRTCHSQGYWTKSSPECMLDC